MSAQNFLLMGPYAFSFKAINSLREEIENIVRLCKQYGTLDPESTEAKEILDKLPFGEDDGIEISWVADMTPDTAIQYLEDSWAGKLDALVEVKSRSDNLSIYFKSEPPNLYDENWDDNYDYEWMIMHFLSTCDLLKIVGIH